MRPHWTLAAVSLPKAVQLPPSGEPGECRPRPQAPFRVDMRHPTCAAGPADGSMARMFDELVYSAVSGSAGLGTTKDRRKIGRMYLPPRWKRTIWPPAASRVLVRLELRPLQT